MSNVKKFFIALEAKGEAVAQRLFHILKATGGEHGHALVEAITADVQAIAPTAQETAHAMMVAASKAAADDPRWSGAEGYVSALVKELDVQLATLGQEAWKELQARLACRIQGLNPDAPLHPGAQSTAPTTQPVDANGAPV